MSWPQLPSITMLSYWSFQIHCWCYGTRGWCCGTSLLSIIFSFGCFSSNSFHFRPDHNFSSVYLQNINISQIYAWKTQDYIGDSIQSIKYLSAHQIPPHLTFAYPQARLKKKNRLKKKKNHSKMQYQFQINVKSVRQICFRQYNPMIPVIQYPCVD